MMNKEKYLIFTRILADQSLLLKDLGLLTTMLILKDDWHYSVEGLSKILPDSKTKIKASINRLQEKGYIESSQKRTATNRFSSMEVKFECPISSRKRVFISKEQYSYIFTILNNLTLRMEDRGMLLRLLFLENADSLSFEGLAQIMPDGITVIQSTIKRLISQHYLIKKQDTQTRKVYYKIVGIMQEVKPNTQSTPKKAKIYNIHFRISRKNQSIIQGNSNPKTTKEEIITTIQGTIGPTTAFENRIIQAAFIRDISLSDILRLIKEVRRSDFLQNKTDVDWECTPDWISKNHLKILTGRYRTYITYTLPNQRPSLFTQQDYDFDSLEKKLLVQRNNALNEYRKKAQIHTSNFKPTENNNNNKIFFKNYNIYNDKNNITPLIS